MFRRKKKSTKTISKSNKNQDSKFKSASKTKTSCTKFTIQKKERNNPYRQKANDLICVGRGGVLAHGAQLPGHRHEFMSEFEN